MPNGTYGGVRGWGRKAPTYSIKIKQDRRINMKTKKAIKDVIAYRKGCKAKGTGLSHYILMRRKAK
jgi:modified peptide precursor CbpA